MDKIADRIISQNGIITALVVVVLLAIWDIFRKQAEKDLDPLAERWYGKAKRAAMWLFRRRPKPTTTPAPAPAERAAQFSNALESERAALMGQTSRYMAAFEDNIRHQRTGDEGVDVTGE